MADDEEKESLLPRLRENKFGSIVKNESELWKTYGMFIVHLSVIIGQCSFAVVNVFGSLHLLRCVHTSIT